MLASREGNAVTEQPVESIEWLAVKGVLEVFPANSSRAQQRAAGYPETFQYRWNPAQL